MEKISPPELAERGPPAAHEATVVPFYLLGQSGSTKFRKSRTFPLDEIMVMIMVTMTT